MQNSLDYISPKMIVKASNRLSKSIKVKLHCRIAVLLEECAAFVNSCICFPFYLLFSLILCFLKALEQYEASIKRINNRFAKVAVLIASYIVIAMIVAALCLFVGVPGVLFFPLNALTKMYVKAIEKTSKQSFLLSGKQAQNSSSAYTQGHSSQTNYHVKENVKYILMAEGMCQRMLQEGLGKFLLKDFCPTTVLTQEDLQNKDITKKKLQCILREIYVFLGISIQTNLVVEWNESSANQVHKTQAGSFSGNILSREIKVIIECDYTPDNVMSILCHECSHAFMEKHNFNWQDTSMNEERTDIMAVLLGFGDYMARGYRVICYTEQKYVSNDRIETKTTRKKVGYITSDECNQIQQYLITHRAEFAAKNKSHNDEIYKKQCFEERLKKLKSELEYNLNCADLLLQQCKFLLDSIPMEVSDKTKCLQISQLLAEYEGFCFEKNISVQREIPQTTDNDKLLENANAVLKKQCNVVSDWIYRYKALIDTDTIILETNSSLPGEDVRNDNS